MSLKGKNVFITGASMGIGRAIALAFATEGANLALAARTLPKLDAVAKEAQAAASAAGHEIVAHAYETDVRDPETIRRSIRHAADHLHIDVAAGECFDVLINNAGLALGAPAPFWKQDIASDITTMVQTNVLGFMAAAHAILCEGGMAAAKRGTVLNITSVTGLEVPPFPGEAVYHASKACQEGFTNALRAELVGTNVRVLALRPGVVQGHFHEQRIGYDSDEYEGFMDGIQALVAEDVARAAVWMVSTPEAVSVKALDVVPSSQRTLQVFDRKWEERNIAKV